MAARKTLTLNDLEKEVVKCRKCPRLVEWREQVATQKRAAYADEKYWGKPVPGFGDPKAKILIVGLAPGAHGSNRTGRMFTGDQSGVWLYDALYRAGLSSQSEAVSVDDGLKLKEVFITAPVKCAPPANKPIPSEKENCKPFIETELACLKSVKVFFVLGSYGYASVAELVGLKPKPKFAHGLEVKLETGQTIVCSYHCSQQNTFTKKLTRPMFDKVIKRAKRLSGI